MKLGLHPARKFMQDFDQASKQLFSATDNKDVGLMRALIAAWVTRASTLSAARANHDPSRSIKH